MKCIFFTITILFLQFTLTAQNNRYQWVKQFTENEVSTERASKIVVDKNRNVFTIGYFDGSVDFDPGPNQYFLKSLYHSIYVSKLDINGDFCWAKIIKGDVIFEPKLLLDNLGNLIISASFDDTIDLDPNAAIKNVIPVGSVDVFIAKWDTDGNYLWSKSFGGSGEEYVLATAMDNTNNLYITGIYESPCDFDPGPREKKIHTPIDGAQTYILKLDQNGNFIFVKALDCENSLNHPNSIAVDSSQNIFITGVYTGTVDFDPDSIGIFKRKGPLAYTSAFILKLMAEGSFAWVVVYEGDYYSNLGQNIITDKIGDVIITGNVVNKLDFDPGPDTFYMQPGPKATFILKLNNNGNFVWAKKFGNSELGPDGGIALDNSNNIYLTSYFFDIIDFDPGVGTHILRDSTGSIYILKLNPDGHFIWVNTYGKRSTGGGTDIYIDYKDNVYVTGLFSNRVDFNPIGTKQELYATGLSDIFILKLGAFADVAVNKINNKPTRYTISPNPTNDLINIQSKDPSTITAIEIYNELGVQVLKLEDKNSFATIHLSDFANGIYFIKIINKDLSSETHKLVKLE